MIVGSPSGDFPAIVWNAFDYEVRVWTSPQARAASPQLGDLMNCQFPFPSNFASNGYIPPVFGSAVGATPFDLPTFTYILRFNVLEGGNATCPPVTLFSGGTYPIAIQAIRDVNVNTGMGIISSLETGVTDIRYTTSNPAGTPVSNFAGTPAQPVLTGRVGYRVVGVPQQP
jgi:hypothetical protein